MSLQLDMCLLAYHSAFMHSSWTYQCPPLLTVKGVNLAVAHDGLATFVTEIVCIFHNDYFDFKGAFFEQFLIRNAV